MQNITITHEMVEHRCPGCGHYWAMEKPRDYSHCGCPYCSSRQRDKLQEQIAKLERSNRSLRGYIKSRKRI